MLKHIRKIEVLRIVFPLLGFSQVFAEVMFHWTFLKCKKTFFFQKQGQTWNSRLNEPVSCRRSAQPLKTCWSSFVCRFNKVSEAYRRQIHFLSKFLKTHCFRELLLLIWICLLQLFFVIRIGEYCISYIN